MLPVDILGIGSGAVLLALGLFSAWRDNRFLSKGIAIAIGGRYCDTWHNLLILKEVTPWIDPLCRQL